MCLFKFPKKGEEVINVRVGGWNPGDHSLFLPKQSSPKANWKQNASKLREEMKKGNPIFDTFIDPVTHEIKETLGFLNAERNLLKSRGWTYNQSVGAWVPPMVK